jgi:hypothetical protein
VARSAKAHEVFLGMRPAFRKRDPVMDFPGRRQFADLAARFTKRMLCQVALTDLPPLLPVTFLCGRVAFVAFIPRVHFLLVVIAIPSIG